MNIPYRTQRTLKRLALALLIIAVAAVLVWLCWLLWLSRFVVYTGNGAILNFEEDPNPPQLMEAVPPETESPFPIYVNEGDQLVETSTELKKLSGYYITSEALQKDMGAVREQLSKLPAGTAVIIEVKNSYGSFYYNTTVGESITGTLDPNEMDELIRYMNSLDLYTIARLPALRDYYFGLHNTRCGLPTAGGYLWADGDYRYWLNPGREGTLTYLASIASELADLGFDEVLFCDFRFPDTDRIVFNGDKLATLAESAQTLVATCASPSFAVSFEGSDGFVPPVGRSRVYYLGADAMDAMTLAENSGVADTAVNLVFITELYDTRFDTYGVMRPLTSAIVEETP